MITIEAQVPEPVMEQARTLAARERIPLGTTHFLGCYAIGGSVESRKLRGASRAAFDEALAEVPDVPPASGDELP